LKDNPVFTIADSIFWLYQNVERNSVTRKLQIMKLRGQTSVPGLHTFRITDAGIQAFSRTLGLSRQKRRKIPAERRLSTGVAELDKMMHGGIPEGDSLLVSGSSGTGKSLIATQFINAGVRKGEPGIVVTFEERPDEYAARAGVFGLDLNTPMNEGRLEIIYLRPLDLSVDETMQEILDAVKRTGAKRLVIDSLAGFEMALSPGFRLDFRESLYRMIFSLTGVGITVLSTVELPESFTDLRFSNGQISFLTDDIVRLRYVSINGKLRKILMVIKMRGGDHSKDICEYQINSAGISIGKPLSDYDNLITGIPTRQPGRGAKENDGTKSPKAEAIPPKARRRR
ncbi:MAG: ATPase domain-containing protein, partial [Terriglobia bacterium]